MLRRYSVKQAIKNDGVVFCRHSLRQQSNSEDPNLGSGDEYVMVDIPLRDDDQSLLVHRDLPERRLGKVLQLLR